MNRVSLHLKGVSAIDVFCVGSIRKIRNPSGMDPRGATISYPKGYAIYVTSTDNSLVLVDLHNQTREYSLVNQGEALIEKDEGDATRTFMLRHENSQAPNIPIVFKPV